MAVPTKQADKNLFRKMCDLMKLETKSDVETLHAGIRANPNLLRWVDKDGHNLLHIGILSNVGIEKIGTILNFDSSQAEVKVNGRLPIHMLLDHICHVPDVMLRIVDAYPNALLTPDYATDGRLPLHVILESTPFPAVYVELGRKLLDKCPDSASVRCHDKLPLQMCLDQGLQPRLTMQVVDAYRGAAAQPNKEGKLPLHQAVENNSDPRVIERILEAYPEALTLPMAVSGTFMSVLEYALRNRRPTSIIRDMIEGGSGKDPKSVALGRAAMMGKMSHYKSAIRARARPQADAMGQAPPTADKGAMARQRKKIDIHMLHITAAGHGIKMDVMPDDKVDTIRYRLSQLIDMPTERIRMTFRRASYGNVQLMDGDELQTYGITTKGAVIEYHERFLLLTMALRNQGDSAITRRLLRARPETAREDDQYGVLPLQLAIQCCAEPDVVMDLIDTYPGAAKKALSGTSGSEYPLHIALKNKYSKTVIEKLLDDCVESDWVQQTGAYRPEQDGFVKKDFGCQLPLHLAIQYGTNAPSIIEIVKLLLKKKCPVEARDKSTGSSALDVCLARDVIEFTLFEYIHREISQSKAPHICEEQGSNGQCPIHVAVAHKSSQAIIELLCTRDKSKEGPKGLLTYDIDGRLPIHLAVAGGASFAVVRTLLSHCPESIHRVDGQGRTPLQIAVTHEAAEGVVFELTRTSKETLHKLDSRGRSLIELACAYDAPPWVVQELLEASPHDTIKLNLLSGKWPNTKASSVAMRFVKEAQKRVKKNAPGRSSVQCIDSYNSTANEQTQEASSESSSSYFGGWFGSW